jgi:hypothetical protein
MGPALLHCVVADAANGFLPCSLRMGSPHVHCVVADAANGFLPCSLRMGQPHVHCVVAGVANGLLPCSLQGLRPRAPPSGLPIHSTPQPVPGPPYAPEQHLLPEVLLHGACHHSSIDRAELPPYRTGVKSSLLLVILVACVCVLPCYHSNIRVDRAGLSPYTPQG